MRLHPLTLSRLALSLALAFSVLTPVTAQGPVSAPTNNANPALKAIASRVESEAAACQVPGYGLAIIDNGRIVLTETRGYSNLASRTAVSVDTVFGLASLTKTFTALALLQLVDQGKINLDDPVGKYINVGPNWHNLKIRDLASMRAGLPASRADELPWPEESRYLQKQPLSYEPGSQFLYSNPSYRVLGDLIAAVSGRPYLQYIAENILQPLDMHHTGTVELANVSSQYVDKRGGLQQIAPKNPWTSYSAGMLAASLGDLCLYAQALLDHKLLSDSAYKTYFYERPPLSTGAAANWGFGWASSINAKAGNRRMLTMNGGLPGVASTIILFPEQRIAVVALANLRHADVYKVSKHAAFAYVNGSVADDDEAVGGSE